MRNLQDLGDFPQGASLSLDGELLVTVRADDLERICFAGRWVVKSDEDREALARLDQGRALARLAAARHRGAE